MTSPTLILPDWTLPVATTPLSATFKTPVTMKMEMLSVSSSSVSFPSVSSVFFPSVSSVSFPSVSSDFFPSVSSDLPSSSSIISVSLVTLFSSSSSLQDANVKTEKVKV